MKDALRYAPLVVDEIDELAEILCNEPVYRHIGGVPSLADFELHHRRALNGPRPGGAPEVWVNIAVRHAVSGKLVGRLEATAHADLAEAAFLYDPAVWGKGYATSGLNWLKDYLRRYDTVRTLWGTTVPQNHRSAALMRRCGFVEVPAVDLPELYSYDAGDLVFRCDLT